MYSTPHNARSTAGSVPLLSMNPQRIAEPRTLEALPPVPTLLSTRLQLELLLSDSSVDLKAAAAIILNDLGATIQIFSRAAEEWDATEEPPTRLEDCLVALGTGVWLEAVSADAVERIAEIVADPFTLNEFWEHARLIAAACWSIADQMEGVNPEEAYLVGLLHEAQHLPELLGWDLPIALSMTSSPLRSFQTENAKRVKGGDDPVFAHYLAEQWRLPACVRSTLTTAAPPWQEILALAHAWWRGEEGQTGYLA